MISTVAFAYAGARVQARYGRLLTAAQWERLQRVPLLSSFLQAARETSLRPWVLQLDASADAHRLEAQLRAAFRRHVATLAQWAPERWRGAILWTDVLPDLPAIAHRARGGADAWMAADPRLARIEFAAPGEISLPGNLQALAGALARRESLAEAWLVHWRSLWPPMLSDERRGLEELVRRVSEAAAAAAPDAPAAQARLLRPLQRLFRRHARAPAGLFAYLALSWRELVMLRGSLMRRRLSLPPEGAAA